MASRVNIPDLATLPPHLCGEINSTIEVFSSLLRAAKTSDDDIKWLRNMLTTEVRRSGLRGFATLIKDWSNQTRTVISRDKDCALYPGYSKSINSWRCRLRHIGVKEDKINEIVTANRDLGGIPPFLVLKNTVDCLIQEPDLSDVLRIAPFMNIGRTAPPGDARKIKESISGFVSNVRNIGPSFDFSTCCAFWTKMALRNRESSQTRLGVSSHASAEFTRDMGGKTGEWMEKVVNDFIDTPISEIIPIRPHEDVYDMTGNVFITPDTWEEDLPIKYCAYPCVRRSAIGSDVLGLFTFLWAVRDVLDSTITHSATMDYPGLACGRVPLISITGGHVKSRVEPLPEEGYKCRIVTITPLSVAICGIVARHMLDPLLWDDVMSLTGLLSGAKLYDVMKELNDQQIKGLDSGLPSFHYEFCNSVDLQTATDTPSREVIDSSLLGTEDSLRHLSGFPIFHFAFGLARVPREFSYRKKVLVNHPDHKSGMMMGEGLSGFFLNQSSSVVRRLVHVLMDEFGDFWDGLTPHDADEFIVQNHDRIQYVLDTPDEWMSYDPTSSQSGDDVISFSDYGLKKWFVLAYRIYGFKPSQTTFYESQRLGVFTEELCFKSLKTNGWTYVDTVKPRLFKASAAGSSAIESLSATLMHIKQISTRVSYRRDEEDFVTEISDIVDRMIEGNKVLRDRITRYNLPTFLPEFLGGCDHPSRFLPDIIHDIEPDHYKMIDYLYKCTDDEFLSYKYSYLSDTLPDEFQEGCRDIIRGLYSTIMSWEIAPKGADPMSSDFDLNFFSRDLIMPRGEMGYVQWLKLTDVMRSEFRLLTFSEIVSHVIASLHICAIMDGVKIPNQNPLILRRNRIEKILSRCSDFIATGPVTFKEVTHLSFRLKGIDDRLIKPQILLECLELDGLPSFSIRTSHF